jgi:ligand-binding sensor domain-containing protein/signal transduction histidine kinase
MKQMGTKSSTSTRAQKLLDQPWRLRQSPGRQTRRVVLVAVMAALIALGFPFSSRTQESGGTSVNTAESPDYPPPGPDLRFEHLTNEQGLSSDKVNSIIQDSKGFMWFGTSDGLNRYDGYDFRTFKYDPNDENSLSSNSVLALYEDQMGSLWIGTAGGGLNRYDPATEQFTHYRHDKDDPHSLGSDRVLAIYQDRQGEIWIGTGGGGLNRLVLIEPEGSEAKSKDSRNARFIRYQHNPDDPQSLSDNAVTAILEDQQGVLWVGTSSGGLNRCTRSPGDEPAVRCASYQHDPDDPDSLRSNEVKFIHEDRTGVLWIGTWGGGLERLDPQTATLEAARFKHFQHDPENPQSLSHNIVLSIHEDEAGVLWLGTIRGLNRFDPQTDQGPGASFTRYQPDLSDPYSLNHPVIMALCGDRTGNLWLGTLAGGVNRVDLVPKPFVHYRNKPEDSNSLASNDVGAVYEDSTGEIWIGTRGAGLDRMNRQTGQVTHYAHSDDDPRSLSDDRIRAIAEDETGMLWLGTADGLNRFDRETEEFFAYRHDAEEPTFLSNNSINALLVDHIGVLWVGTFAGLDRFEPETAHFVHFRHDPDDPSSLSNDTVRTLYEDQTGVLWIGTTGGGLNRFDRRTQQFTRYQHRPGDPQSLGDNEVISIHWDTTGVLWVGTSTGLDRFDPETQRFSHYGERNGLPGASVVGILEDSAPPELGGPNLWLSTSQGLSKFNPQSESFRNYDISDGLQGNQFTQNAAFKSESGEMFFGGPNGLTSFFPSEILDSPHVPPIVITGFELSNRPVEIGKASVLQRVIGETDQVKLSFQDRVISFKFAALDYRAPHKNLYRYMLEGFDETWIEAQSDRRFVTYTNLDPGEYVFRVAGSNNDGVWNEGGVAIGLTITPPWWETTWFRGLVLAVLVGVVAAGYRWRVRGIQARSRELAQEVADKTKDLQGEIAEREATEERLRKTRDDLATLLAVSQDIVSTLDLDQLLQIVMDQLSQVVHHDLASIHLVAGGIMEMHAFERANTEIAPPPHHVRYAAVPAFQNMISSKKAFAVADLQQDRLLKESILASTDGRSGQVPPGVRSFMAVPLIAQDRTIGMVVLVSQKPDLYDDEALELAQAFANQAAIAIENARLYRGAQETATLEERNRVARELHDSATQALYSAMLFSDTGKALTAAGDLQAAQHYQDRVSEVLLQALKEMRLLIYELRPPELESEGLIGGLQLRLDAVESRIGMDAQLRADDLPDLPHDVTENLYRISLEALNNVLKHAQADTVTVSLHSEGRVVTLEIADDGQGFDPDDVQGHGGLGLISMQERVQKLGAELEIDSTQGQGTRLSIRLEVPA